MSDEKKIINLTIFLLKEEADSFADYLKDPQKCSMSPVKPEYGFEGIVCYPETTSKIPKWKNYVEDLASDEIEISDNSSNKAVVFAKISCKTLAVVFGYGRALLKENLIERNFGLKVALNIIDPLKMKSIQAATVEDMVVSIQVQASYSAPQEEFGLNIENDIMCGVTGNPDDSKYGNTITGKDSLAVAVSMTLNELKSKLEIFLEAYYENTYRIKGFEWVDNVKEIKDEFLKETLDFNLVDAIRERETSNLYIAPAEILDWEKTIGFCFGGIGKKSEDAENYSLEIDLSDYLNKIKPKTNIFAKIKRDKLFAITLSEEIYSTGSVYNSLIFQTSYENDTYILVSGNWYRIDGNFYNQVYDYVQKSIPIYSGDLPVCLAGESEKEYNIRVCKDDDNFALMDCKLVSVTGGKKQIEACDIFTKEKQFIHIKNKGKSAQLSHLFSQGKVAAQCFVSDKAFRNQVYEKIVSKLGEKIFTPADRPKPNEYEVVFAIIDNNVHPVCDSLPFFSLLNLMLTAQDLERMHIKCSVVKIKKG